MLIKLTAVMHPDINAGQPLPVYVDPKRVLLITPGFVQHAKEGSIEQHRQAMQSLFEEVQRVSAEAGSAGPPKNWHPDSEQEAEKTGHEMQRWLNAKEAAASLTAAYQLVARAGSQVGLHPRRACTEVQLACGTALENGVMLARVWVTEPPEKVAHMVEYPEEYR